MPSHLFSPITLGTLPLANRIVVAPMCQYSAVNGTMTDWHLMHLGQFAVSGAGLVFVEATGVEARGRITDGCVGLYNDENEAAMARVVRFYRDYGHARLGIQLAHAGRKGSSEVPWRGGAPLPADNSRAWKTVAPSPIPFDDKGPAPEPLDAAGLQEVKNAFLAASRRALRLGFQAIEMHAAHGYLMHQFLSPLSNRRSDAYGGDLAGRMRFPLEVFEALRAETPKDVALGVRVSATDWVDGGWDVAGTVAFAKELKARGCDFIDVSSGGNSPLQKIPAGPGYQTAFAAEVRRATGMPTMAVGMITDPLQAETILASGQADMVALARGMLWDPHWAWHAAEALGETPLFPPQYKRAHGILKGDPSPAHTPEVRN